MPGQEGGVLSGPDIGPHQAALLPPWPLDNPSEIELSWRVTEDQPWRRQPNGASKGQLSLQREGKQQHLICDPEKLLKGKRAATFQLGNSWSLFSKSPSGYHGFTSPYSWAELWWNTNHAHVLQTGFKWQTVSDHIS